MPLVCPLYLTHAGFAAGAGRSSGLLNLLLAVQTAAFTIQMRVQLPSRVQELLQHFKWATFDIRWGSWQLLPL